MDKEITLQDMKKLLSEIKPKCNKKHNYNITGGCFECGEIWLGKKDHNNIKELLK